MSIRMLFPHHWQTMAWANGGGITHEILKDTHTPWRYRVSVADVDSDGAFSVFEGIDRQIMMLQGKGFDLHFNNGFKHAISEINEPFAFDGDEPVHCTLRDGAVRDFNVMTRRGAADAYLTLDELDARCSTHLLSAQLYLLYVLEGEAVMELNGHAFMLDAQQMALIEHEQGEMLLSAMTPQARSLCIAIYLHSEA